LKLFDAYDNLIKTIENITPVQKYITGTGLKLDGNEFAIDDTVMSTINGSVNIILPTPIYTVPAGMTWDDLVTAARHNRLYAFDFDSNFGGSDDRRILFQAVILSANTDSIMFTSVSNTMYTDVKDVSTVYIKQLDKLSDNKLIWRWSTKRDIGGSMTLSAGPGIDITNNTVSLKYTIKEI